MDNRSIFSQKTDKSFSFFTVPQVKHRKFNQIYKKDPFQKLISSQLDALKLEDTFDSSFQNLMMNILNNHDYAKSLEEMRKMLAEDNINGDKLVKVVSNEFITALLEIATNARDNTIQLDSLLILANMAYFLKDNLYFSDFSVLVAEQAMNIVLLIEESPANPSAKNTLFEGVLF